MARGLPGVWSLIFGLPFCLFGLYVYAGFTDFSSTPGLPILAFGLFVIGLGLYIHFVASPPAPNLGDEEEVIERRHPAQRAAIVKSWLGLVLVGAAGYLLFFTFYPYVYPTVTLSIGLYVFLTGLYAYWTNTLTTYYVTNNRIIKEYRFISLVRQEVPFSKVRGVETRKSIWEALVGLGNVRVASGGGRTLEIVIRNIISPTKFADEVRSRI